MKRCAVGFAAMLPLAFASTAMAGLTGSQYNAGTAATGTVTINPAGAIFAAPNGPSFCVGPNGDNCGTSGLFGSVAISATQITFNFAGSTDAANGTFTLNFTNFNSQITNVTLHSGSLNAGAFALTSFTGSSIVFTGTTTTGFAAVGGAAIVFDVTTASVNGLTQSQFNFSTAQTGSVTIGGTGAGGAFSVPNGPTFCVGPNGDNCSTSGLFGSVAISDTQITFRFAGSTSGANGTFVLSLTNFSVPILNVIYNSGALAGGAFGLTSFTSSSMVFTGTTTADFNAVGGETIVFDVNTLAPPAVTTSFGAASIALGGTTSLSFTIANPNPSNVLNGLTLTETLPAGLIVATPAGLTFPCGGGVTTGTGGSTIFLAFATLAPSGSCTFTLNVTGTTPGVKNNSVTVGSTIGTSSPSNASLTVLALAPAITTTFGAASIALGGSTSLSFTVTNPNTATTLTGAGFTDTLPAGLVVATPNGLTANCAANNVINSGGGIAAFTGFTVVPGGSCTFGVNVTGTAPGIKNNSVTVNSTNGGVGNTANASLTVLALAPAITTAFGAASILVGGSTSLTFTVTNPNTATALTGVGFTDTLPAGLVVATPNGLTANCGMSMVINSGGGIVAFTGFTVLPGGSCAFGVNVTGTVPGIRNNPVTVNSTNGGVGNTANASLTVLGQLSANPGSLTLSVMFGSNTSQAGFAISSTGALTAQVSSSQNWLLVNGSNSTNVALAANIPASVTVSVNSNNLRPGPNSGTITVSSVNAAAPVQIAVVANVTVPLSVSPSGLSFTSFLGLGAPSPQTLTVSSAGAPISFSAYSVGGTWLKVDTSASTTPGTVRVSVDPTGLGAGTYSGSVYVSAPQGSPPGITIGVTLTIPAPGPIEGLPATGISLTASAGKPATQVLQLMDDGDEIPVPFRISFVPSGKTVIQGSQGAAQAAQDASVPAFVSVSPSSGVTPASVLLTTTPVPAGYVYEGNLTVTTPSETTSSKITLTMPPIPALALKIAPATISLSTVQGNAVSRSLLIERLGGDSSQTDPYSISVNPASSNWLKVSPSSGTLNIGSSQQIQVALNTNSLATGFYQGILSVTLGSAPAQQVPVYLSVLSNNPVMALDFQGISFYARQGNGNTLPQNVSVLNAGSGTLNWTAAIKNGSSWLTLSNSSGVSLPGNPSSFTVGVNPGFAASAGIGAYSAVVTITDQLSGSSQIFTALLTITDPGLTPPDPIPNPTGLVFDGQQGGSDPPSQTVQVFTSSQAAVPFQTAAQMYSGVQGWLVVSPAAGMVSTNTPAPLTVQAHTSGLAPGVYRGGVTVSIGGKIRVVNISLIVTPGASPVSVSAHGLAPEDSGAPACIVTSLVPTIIGGLTDNFSTSISGPVAIAVQVTDNCGNIVPNPTSSNPPALVTLSFDSQTPGAYTMVLSDPRHSTYTREWIPDTDITVTTVTVTASLPAAGGIANAIAGVTQVVGQVNASSAPSLKSSGVVDYFNAEFGVTLSPGEMIRLSGANLSGVSKPAAATGTPWPFLLGGTQVIIAGELATLLSVSPTDVAVQIPTDLAPGRIYPVQLIVNGIYTVPEYISLAPASPGLDENSDGTVVAQHADATPITTTNPARPGEEITIYVTGMGATTPPVPYGATAPVAPPFAMVDPMLKPAVALDGLDAGPILFAGLTPGYIGLYQINFVVPSGTAAGLRQITVSENNLTSNQAILPVGSAPAAALAPFDSKPAQREERLPAWPFAAPPKAKR